MAADEPRHGDRVEWNTSQGPTTGTVERRLTSRTSVEGHTVAASKDEPQFLVRSEKTGKVAAHKPSALHKQGGRGRRARRRRT
jgi:hypothetical protein